MKGIGFDRLVSLHNAVMSTGVYVSIPSVKLTPPVSSGWSMQRKKIRHNTGVVSA